MKKIRKLLPIFMILPVIVAIPLTVYVVTRKETTDIGREASASCNLRTTIDGEFLLINGERTFPLLILDGPTWKFHIEGEEFYNDRESFSRYLKGIGVDYAFRGFDDTTPLSFMCNHIGVLAPGHDNYPTKRCGELLNESELLGYLNRDEPNLPWLDRDQMIQATRDLYNNVKSFETSRSCEKIVLLNYAPMNNDLLTWANFGDILSVDVYPVGQPSGDLPLNEVGVWADRIKDVVSENGRQEKPVWFFLQGGSWGVWNRVNDPSCTDSIVFPSYHQNRFMAYDTIVHGVTGLMWYGGHHVHSIDEVDSVTRNNHWSDKARIISEISINKRILTLENVNDVNAVTTNGVINHLGEPAVKSLVKNDMDLDKLIMIVVNESNQQAQFSVEIPGAYGVLEKIIIKDPFGGEIDNVGYTFNDNIEGWGVKIYEIVFKCEQNCESKQCVVSDIHGRNGLDSKINGWDLSMILASFKKPFGEFNLTADIYGPKSNSYEKDGKVDGYDLAKVLACWGEL